MSLSPTRSVRPSLALAGLFLASLAPLGSARQLWADDFEAYAPGSFLEGQGGWNNWTGIALPITTVGTDGNPGRSALLGSGSDTVMNLSFLGLDSGRVRLTADVYVPTSPTTAWFVLMNDYSIGGPYEWGLQIGLDGSTGLATVEAAGQEIVTVLVRDAWIPLRVDIDFDADLAEVYLDGALIVSYPWSSGVFGSTSAYQLDAINLYTPTSTVGGVRVDNLRLIDPSNAPTTFRGFEVSGLGPSFLNVAASLEVSDFSGGGLLVKTNNEIEDEQFVALDYELPGSSVGDRIFVTGQGVVAGSTEDLMQLEIESTGADAARLSPTFPYAPDDTYEISLFANGELIHEELGSGATQLTATGVKAVAYIVRTEGGTTHVFCYRLLPIMESEFDLNGVVYDADTVMFRRALQSSLDGVDMTGVAVTGQGPTELHVTDLYQSFEGVPVTGLGASKLVVSNLGSSGHDGVRLTVSNLGSSGLDGVAFQPDSEAFHAELDYPQGHEPGATLTLAFDAVVTGGQGAIGSLALQESGGTVSITPDYTAVGSTTHIIEVLSNHQVIGLAIGHSGVAALAPTFPQKCRKVSDWDQWTTTCFELCWPVPVTITVPGVGDFQGDGLRVLAENGVTVDELTSLSITASGIPELGIAEVESLGPVGTSYCVGAPNSVGSGGVIGAFGSPSVGFNDLELHVTGVPNQFGIFYFGPNQATVPFGDGARCVGGQTVRLLPAAAAVGNANERPLDFSGTGGEAAIEGGDTWYFQYWYRDPAALGTGFNLSNAIEITFEP